MPEPVLCIHGGAGQWSDEIADPAQGAPVHAGLAAALAAGGALLAAGGSALDAAQAAVAVLEADPVFNAGRGGALTSGGWVECDAAIIDGRDGRAGAVAGLRRTRSPVAAARHLLDEGRHVLLAGAEGESWLHQHGVEACPPEWLVVERSRAELERWRAGDHGRRGTVGAVALDRAGRLAAATSTGGLTGKRPGRVGDSPLIGAGTWADGAAAISCTGLGEAFIRAGFALRTALAVGGGVTPAAAAADGLARVSSFGGTGGTIVLAADGRWELATSDPAMARGVWSRGSSQTWIAR
jgi:beta-aspartyl-peptidase (threonine type)